MHQLFEQVCNSLDQLSTRVTNAWQNDALLCDALGWNHPALTRHDLAALPKNLAARIRAADPADIDSTMEAMLSTVPIKIDRLIAQNLPHMFNGNGSQAIPAYIGMFDWLNELLNPLFQKKVSMDWENITDPKAMPHHLAKRLRYLQDHINQIEPNIEALDDQVALIKNASATAEALPTDLRALQDAKKQIEAIATECAKLHVKIETELRHAEVCAMHSKDHSQETEKLVSQCEEAYRITTTKGLAAAFDERATRLARSMWVWVLGLLFALGMAGLLGAYRIKYISALLAVPNPDFRGVWIHLFLAFLGIAGPVWFAWLSTKQIGQRFRLAEDYAFKASIAKAYEGYRKEAARIDESFEKRLFGSALDRLEEAPLRLVEAATHGSPWHEFFESEGFKKALEMVPELKDKFSATIMRGFSVAKSKTKMSTPAPENRPGPKDDAGE